jgi:hypothetical protein
MYFGRMLRRLRSASAVARASIRRPSLSSGMPTAPRQPGQRALIGIALDDHGVATGGEGLIDEVERLQRARHQQDIVDTATDAGVTVQLGDQEFAQPTIALRPAGETIGRQRSSFAPQHGRHGVDQTIDGNLVRIIVAADKTVVREPAPWRGRSRQVVRQQRRKVEARGAHWRVRPGLLCRCR